MPTPTDKDSADLINAELDKAGFDADLNIVSDEAATEETTETTTDDVTAEETVVTDDTEAATEAATEVVEETPEDKAAKEAAAKAAAQDEFDALCDELGFRAPKPGQRENKIPQSRVRARVKTALKKYADKFGIERTDLTAKIEAAKTRMQEADNWDALVAAKDVDGAKAFLRRLALIHPVYESFVTGGTASTTVAAIPQAIRDLGAKPGPDIKYDDGSTGYSPEQLEKREDWLVAKARIEASEAITKQFETRFGPMEAAHKSAAVRAQEAPKIAARLERLRAQWGQPFLDDEAKDTNGSEILAHRRQHPELTFEECVAAVLIPKMQADRNKMRAGIIKEMNDRKAKAGKTTSQQTRSVTTSGPKTTEQVIEEAAARAGI